MFVLAIYRDGTKLGYVACQDASDVTTTTERHARRFQDWRSASEYVDMARGGRTRFQPRSYDVFKVESATPLF